MHLKLIAVFNTTLIWLKSSPYIPHIQSEFAGAAIDTVRFIPCAAVTVQTARNTLLNYLEMTGLNLGTRKKIFQKLQQLTLIIKLFKKALQ